MSRYNAESSTDQMRLLGSFNRVVKGVGKETEESSPLEPPSSEWQSSSARTRGPSPLPASCTLPLTEKKVASLRSSGVSHLTALTCFNFPYGCVCTTMGLFILPAEALRLFPASESVALGLFLLTVGISQLVCPYVGLISDRCTSRYGRRRPFIALGGMCCLASLFIMWAASLTMRPWLFAFGLLSAMLSLNTVYSAQCGLVPDLVSESKQGEVSGIIALEQLTGSMVGFLFVIATKDNDFHLVYPFYLLLLVATLATLLCSVQEVPLETKPMPLMWRDIVRSYVIDTSKDLDFYWVFISRIFFYMAISCQAFMLYYLRDVVGTSSEADKRQQMATIALIGQATAALIAYPVGKLSDQSLGRKPLIYISCAVMCIVYIAFILAPLYISSRWLITTIFVVAAFYGMGNGCYLAVDYALALDCLPSKATSAQDLGVWGIAAFLGTAIGPLIWGFILGVAGRKAGDPNAYTMHGYTAMLLGGCLACIGAGFFVRFVKGAR